MLALTPSSPRFALEAIPILFSRPLRDGYASLISALRVNNSRHYTLRCELLANFSLEFVYFGGGLARISLTCAGFIHSGSFLRMWHSSRRPYRHLLSCADFFEPISTTISRRRGIRLP